MGRLRCAFVLGAEVPPGGVWWRPGPLSGASWGVQELGVLAARRLLAGVALGTGVALALEPAAALSGVAVFHACREVVGVAEGPQFDLWGAPRVGCVAGKLAVL